MYYPASFTISKVLLADFAVFYVVPPCKLRRIQIQHFPHQRCESGSYSNRIPNRVFLRRCNALWDAGWRRSQDGSERQAEDRPCGGKALKKEVLDTERNPTKFARCRRRRGRLMDLARSQIATGWQKQSNIKSRMNSDEKEDCECAPPQAETSAAGGAYR